MIECGVLSHPNEQLVLVPHPKIPAGGDLRTQLGGTLPDAPRVPLARALGTRGGVTSVRFASDLFGRRSPSPRSVQEVSVQPLAS